MPISMQGDDRAHSSFNLRPSVKGLFILYQNQYAKLTPIQLASRWSTGPHDPSIIRNHKWETMEKI